MKFLVFAFFLGLVPYRVSAADASCEDASRIYKVCSDQAELFEAKLREAKEHGKLLITVMGAEWCPWCVSLHHIFVDPSLSKDIAAKFLVVDLAVFNGKEKVPATQNVMKKLQHFTQNWQKPEGIPMLFVVNPLSQKAVMIDTAPLEHNTKTSKGHDSKKVLAALEHAARQLK